MGTIKTAISIDEVIFKQVDQLSKKLHISRSRFFSQAAQYMIEKDENLELLKKINAAVGNQTEEDDHTKHQKTYTQKKFAEKW